jgi:2-dehydropantoate 2-reductase
MLDAAGNIHHLNKLHRLTLGPRLPAQTAAAHALHETFKNGAFELRHSDVIMQELWEKFVFLTTYAGITTLLRAPINAILATSEGARIALEMLDECTRTAAANGYAPRAEAQQHAHAMLLDATSRGTASMLRDMQAHGRTEHEQILGDVLARERASGLSAPLLRVALTNMQAYEAQRRMTTLAAQSSQSAQ